MLIGKSWDSIEKALIAMGWSISDLARRTGYEERTLKRVQSGEIPISGKLLKSVQNAVNTAIFTPSPRQALAFALKRYNLTPADLAKKIGYDAGVINNVIRGTGRASEEMIELIVGAMPDLSKEELMEGSDSPTILSEGTHGTHGAKSKVILPAGMKGRMVPLLSMAQAGGWDAAHSDEGWSGEAVFALNVDDRRAFAIRVSGNSMEHVIFEGDVVICSPRADLAQGRCAVVRTKSEHAYIKYWRRRGDVVVLESENKDFKPITLPASDIVGAWPVVQHISSREIKKGV